MKCSKFLEEIYQKADVRLLDLKLSLVVYNRDLGLFVMQLLPQLWLLKFDDLCKVSVCIRLSLHLEVTECYLEEVLRSGGHHQEDYGVDLTAQGALLLTDPEGCTR